MTVHAVEAISESLSHRILIIEKVELLFQSNKYVLLFSDRMMLI